MNREVMIQVGVIYGPLVMAGLLTLWKRPKRRLAIGLLFSTLWQAAMLPWFDLAARALGLWSYEFDGPSLAGIPLTIYFGWIIAWGWLAPMAASTSGKAWPLVITALIALDLWIMPQMEPVVTLSKGWWIADAVLFLGLLLPSMLLCHWTHCETHLNARVGLLAGCFGGLLLGIPMLASLQPDELNSSLQRCLDQPGWLVAAAVLALPGLAAMRDLARSGGGTPVPIDPTKRLVSHGVYGFVGNPMQISMTLLLLLEAWYLENYWPLVIAILGVVYSEGFARWSEAQDMLSRFGTAWTSYRSRIRLWIPRWKPIVLDECELWIDEDCNPCSSAGQWFRHRQPNGLTIRHARDWPGEALQRITWHHPASGRRECGTAAVAMALQHMSLPWALAGLLLGAPVLRQVIQCCLDAAGLGPRATAK